MAARRGVRLVVMVLLVIACSLSAQGIPVVRGTIRDATGGAIAGARVTLTAQPQVPKRQWTGTSDASGQYELKVPGPGRYLLSVSMPGFATADRLLQVTGDAAQNGDVVLQVAIAEQVVVVSSLEDLRRATGMRPTGLLLGGDELNLLPSDPDMLLQVLQELSAASGRPDQVAVYVDGEPIASRLPPRESILSIRISTNVYASEFAEPSKGLVEVVTRPATSRYHGESQFTLNDSLLNARHAFERVKQPSHTRAWSGYLAGPIVRNRWSVLGYAGRWDRNDHQIVNSTLVDPVRHAAEPFVANVATPARTESFSLRSDVALTSRHLASVEFVRNRDSARNQGLQTGLDLPERALNRDGRSDIVRVGVVSAFSSRDLLEIRARTERHRLAERAVIDAPAVLVLDAFYAGGNQSHRQERLTDDFSIVGSLTRTLATHAVRIGGRVDSSSIDQFRQANLLGTFLFGAEVDGGGSVVATPLERYLRTLNGVAGYGPSSFAITRGESHIRFRDWQASWFMQDDWRPWPTLTVSYGVRHDLQRQARSWWTFAPRAGLAWMPAGDTRHVLRVAGGLFYSRIPTDLALDVLRHDGLQVREYVVARPDFFPAVPEGVEARGTSLPTVRVSDALDAPRTTAVSAGYEWQIATPLFASITYTYRRGERLLRTLNINQPDPVTGRPHPDLGPILQFSSSGRSTTREMIVTLRRALTNVSLFATYTWGLSRSDTDGPYTVAADSVSLQGEFGRAGDDERHRLAGGAVVSLPGDASISALLTASSGRPFNITTGRDDNGDLLFVDRPGAGAAETGSRETPFGFVDVSRRADQSMIERNTGRGPSQFILNVGVGKKFVLGRPAPSGRGAAPYLILSASAENVINRVNYVDVNGVVTSPLFGTANRALNPRRVELAARVGF